MNSLSRAEPMRVVVDESFAAHAGANGRTSRARVQRNEELASAATPSRPAARRSRKRSADVIREEARELLSTIREKCQGEDWRWDAWSSSRLAGLDGRGEAALTDARASGYADALELLVGTEDARWKRARLRRDALDVARCKNVRALESVLGIVHERVQAFDRSPARGKRKRSSRASPASVPKTAR